MTMLLVVTHNLGIYVQSLDFTVSQSFTISVLLSLLLLLLLLLLLVFSIFVAIW